MLIISPYRKSSMWASWRPIWRTSNNWNTTSGSCKSMISWCWSWRPRGIIGSTRRRSTFCKSTTHPAKSQLWKASSIPSDWSWTYSWGTSISYRKIGWAFLTGWRSWTRTILRKIWAHWKPRSVPRSFTISRSSSSSSGKSSANTKRMRNPSSPPWNLNLSRPNGNYRSSRARTISSTSSTTSMRTWSWRLCINESPSTKSTWSTSPSRILYRISRRRRPMSGSRSKKSTIFWPWSTLKSYTTTTSNEIHIWSTLRNPWPWSRRSWSNWGWPVLWALRSSTPQLSTKRSSRITSSYKIWSSRRMKAYKKCSIMSHTVWFFKPWWNINRKSPMIRSSRISTEAWYPTSQRSRRCSNRPSMNSLRWRIICPIFRF